MLRVAIVGLGPWGLCALERIVASMCDRPKRPGEVEVHIIEPSSPGVGIYDTTQPDYLEMNTSCIDVSMFPFQRAGRETPYALGLFEWTVARGYRWIDGVCAIDPRGRAIEPEDFLPRRVMGEYLHFFYGALKSVAQGKLKLFHHSTSAVDVVQRQDGCEEVHLSNGRSIAVDHVILTFGHVPNDTGDIRSRGVPLVDPYPAATHLASIPPGAKVAVLGMGLVGADVVAGLTIGRGGRFVDECGRLVYRPSGREPKVELMSPSGRPYRAKTVSNTEFPERKRPIVFSNEAISRLQDREPASTDFRREVLPLLLSEMRARYYAQSVFTTDGEAECLEISEQLRSAWGEGSFDECIAPLAKRFGAFDAEAFLFGHDAQHGSSADYQGFTCSVILEDVDEQKRLGSASPLTAAVEVFRVFRDTIRSVVECKRLTLDSHRDFHGNIRKNISRLISGPPAWRLRQMVALVESGVLSLPYGPAPELSASARPGKVQISSTALARPYANFVDTVVRGYLETPSVEASASPLVRTLYRKGRLIPLRYGNVSVGSVDITADAHPMNREGQPQPRLWLFGSVTEGARYHTNYVPSARRGIQAIKDIGSCVAAILC